MGGAPVGNTNGHKWTIEQADALRLLVLENRMSYGVIAAKINEQFGTDYSRNAAIGRAGRMGLITPCKVKTATLRQPKVRNKSRPRIIANNGNSRSMRVITSFE